MVIRTYCLFTGGKTSTHMTNDSNEGLTVSAKVAAHQVYREIPDELKPFAEVDSITGQITFINSRTKERPEMMRRGIEWNNNRMARILHGPSAEEMLGAAMQMEVARLGVEIAAEAARYEEELKAGGNERQFLARTYGCHAAMNLVELLTECLEQGMSVPEALKKGNEVTEAYLREPEQLFEDSNQATTENRIEIVAAVSKFARKLKEESPRMMVKHIETIRSGLAKR